MTEQTKCIADAQTVKTACKALAKVAGYSSEKKGVVSWQYINMVTDKPGRTLYGVKCPEYPDGLVFNYCPFCGEKHPGALRAELSAAADKLETA